MTNFIGKANKYTVLKHTPLRQSSEITDPNMKFGLTVSQTLKIRSYSEISGHYKIVLEEPIKGRLTWYAFIPDIDIKSNQEKGKIKNAINLNVPFFSQRDNAIRPFQTCNVTCCAMIIEYFHPGTAAKVVGQLEDTLTRKIVRKHGHSGIYYHHHLVELLREYGVKSRFSTTTPFSQLKSYLSSGFPCIYSGKFTRSGHIIVIRGFDDNGFFVNDPYGEWFSFGYPPRSNGENRHYSYNLIQNVSYSGSSSGWIHLCSPL